MLQPLQQKMLLLLLLLLLRSYLVILDTMAKIEVSSWTACIRILQQLVDAPCTAPDTSMARCEAAKAAVLKCAGDGGDSPLPNSAWKKLVHDVKVRSCTVSHTKRPS